MRIGIVVAGVVLIVIGAVLLFVPITDQGTQTVTSSAPEVLQVSGFSITGSIPVSISWTSSSAVEVLAAACSSSCDTGNINAISGLTIQSGTSGSFTLNQPNGGEIVLGVITTGGSSASATFTVKTALSLVGTILLLVGIVILIVGAVLRSRPKAEAMPPAPVEPAEATTEPMSHT